MSRDRAVCRHCRADVYRNMNPAADVKAWVHYATGSRYCDRTERTTAEPEDVA